MAVVTNCINSAISALATNNIFIGGAGNSTLTGAENVGAGASSITALTSGSVNVCVGYNTGNYITTGEGNVYVGSGAGLGTSASSGTNFNVSVGYSALTGIQGSAGGNSCLGTSALTGVESGAYNVAIGYGAGSFYTSSESYNVILGNTSGVVGESNVLRLGSDASVSATTKAYITGVASVSVSNKNIVTINTSTGQLGSDASVAVAQGGTGVATFTTNGILYGNSTTSILVTAAGTSGQILTNSSGVPAWTTNTYPATDVTGDLLYASTTNVISGLAIGSTGQVLTVAAGLPSWATPGTVAPTYVDETSTTVAMSNGNYYSSDSSSLITYTLPSTAAFGTLLAVFGYNTGGWKIAQNASQNIRMGNTVTTTGTGGSLASSARGDCVQMYCAVANTTWVVTSSMGNVTIV